MRQRHLSRHQSYGRKEKTSKWAIVSEVILRRQGNGIEKLGDLLEVPDDERLPSLGSDLFDQRVVFAVSFIRQIVSAQYYSRL